MRHSRRPPVKMEGFRNLGTATSPGSLPYLRHRVDQSCGISVPTSIRATVAWIHARLGMQSPNTNSDMCKAMTECNTEHKDHTVKEAKPLPMTLVGSLEHLAAKDDGAKSLLAGYMLCLIYASLRFDDGKHVKPHLLRLEDGALRGTSWQTKTDRKRAGTNFAVTDTFISREGWLRKWFQTFTSRYMTEREISGCPM